MAWHNGRSAHRARCTPPGPGPHSAEHSAVCGPVPWDWGDRSCWSHLALSVHLGAGVSPSCSHPLLQDCPLQLSLCPSGIFFLKHSPCPAPNPAGTLSSAPSSGCWEVLWALTQTPFPHPLWSLPEASETPGQSLNTIQAFPHPGLGLALAVFSLTSSSLPLPCCSPFRWKILLVFQLWLKCHPPFRISPPPVSTRSSSLWPPCSLWISEMYFFLSGL